MPKKPGECGLNYIIFAGAPDNDKVWSERDILASVRQRATPTSGIALGIGDDCAIYRPTPGEELVFTTDFYIEDVHFGFATHTAAQVGHNALARGLSDIAAMGAEPRVCLLSLAIPPHANARWVKSFYRGLLRLADFTGTALAGGDLSRATKLHCDIVVCGAVPAGTALLRAGANAEDAIYVSGALGGSALGLATKCGAAWKRHLHIEPRLRLGRFLRTRLKATACMDLSDGLSLDLNRLCLESKLSAHIRMPPLFAKASPAQALHGGEDYELLFTVPPTQKVPAQFEGLRLTRIGSMEAGKPGQVLLNGTKLLPAGYDHFRR